eukprot:CAMPEP_0179212188 /NCGR_PEP_ID=MMETSP0797-20121207/962_1 /TAXON_ID=47934 /ORGANISM="Dinophysis acuminata, Strain DAEP01" /LENGTH=587 /DNA_ID=CAMNT_0020917763 /DNA_START=1 /DNA_END=1761 /DNA_ORIENTATION=-
MAIYGTGEKFTLSIRMCTTISEIREILAKKLGVPQDTFQFIVKRGCTYAKLQECDQMPSKVTVRGVASWVRTRQQYAHPIVIIGAGHNGLRQALECVRQGVDDFVLFDRLGQVGGDAWVLQANGTSKLQTELGTYHLHYGDAYPVPTGLPTYPSRDEILRHFRDSVEEYGISPHIRLQTSVVSMQLPPKSSGHAAVNSAADPAKCYELVTEPEGGERASCSASSVLMFPGNLTLPKEELYKGEDLFGGAVGYGMFNEFDYSRTRDQNVAIVGMGAFSIENTRTCLEHDALKCFLVCRRKNLVMPRVVSWFINQSIFPPSAGEMLHAMEPAYALAADDPWEYYGVVASKDRRNVRISQRARFPVSDVHFLALYYGKAEVVTDSVSRLRRHEVLLQGGRSLHASCLIKVFGFRGSPAVDELMHVDVMYGYWPQTDCRRWLYSESPGVDFAKIGGTTLSPAAIMMAEVALNFLKYPKDFEALVRSNGLVAQKPDKSSDNAKYVISARNATNISLVLSAMLPFLAERDFNSIKRKKQHECHPIDNFVDELELEWSSYCKKFSATSNVQPPPYMFNTVTVRELCKANDDAGW